MKKYLDTTNLMKILWPPKISHFVSRWFLMAFKDTETGVLQQPGRVTAGVLVFLMKMRPPTSHHWLISGLKGIANISHHLCHTNILQLQHIYTQTTLHHLFRCESYSRNTTVWYPYSYACLSKTLMLFLNKVNFWIQNIHSGFSYKV